MATTTTGNINNTGQVLQTWLNRQVLKNLEPMLRFYDMGKKPTYQKGYHTIAWTRVRKMKVSATSALLTEGTTPSEQALLMDTITLTAKQYGIYVTLSDFLLDTAPIKLIKEAAVVVGENMARIIDEAIQTNLSTNGTNVLFGGTAANRAALGAGDTMTANLLAKSNAFLSTKASKPFGDSYLGIMHPNVIYDLQVQSGTGTFIDVNKYTKHTSKIMRGEIGMLYGVRIVKSAFVQTFASTVTVYPTYIMGRDSYGVADLQKKMAYITPRKASDSDPLAQRVKVGSKCAFESIILEQDSLLRVETASTLAYAWA